MAYVDWSAVKEVDYSIPYKTFNDLKDDDKIFLIDFKDLTIKEFDIKHFNKKENNSYKALNRYEVTFEIPGVAHVNIYDGNRYLDKVYFTYNSEYITTDKRIADIIIYLLQSRNSYQYECLTGIFGNPTYKNSSENIKLN